ncbi:hypothetical protein Angca_001339, partial [Angiostrongylus cantonensis]
LINGHSMSDSITGIDHNACRSPRCEQREHSLDSSVHSRCVKRFEHQFRHPFAVRFRIQWLFSEQHRMLAGRDPQFIRKHVLPYLLHIFPVFHNAALDGMLK